MDDKRELIKLKYEIEEKRKKLNNIILNNISKKEILEFSQELDLLITKYTLYTYKMAE